MQGSGRGRPEGSGGGYWPGTWPWRPARPDGLARGPGYMAGWSGGQHPGAALTGQALAGQVAKVQHGGAALEPGVVLGHPAVAELEAASPPGGDLGDGALDVGPVF